MEQPQRANLTGKQKAILGEFYALPYEKVVFQKPKRKAIWDVFKDSRTYPEDDLKELCPALLAELEKSKLTGKLIQSAVFSECVYAQAIAKMFRLTNFEVASSASTALEERIMGILAKNGIKPRYIYSSNESNWTLVQAGGFGGVDCALVSHKTNEIYYIEFKEPGAKTSELDLPEYEEDGFLVSSKKFEEQYPQFVEMLEEKIAQATNFWDVMGSNVKNFSPASVEKAMSENYAGQKFADVICVEDINGYLTMIPANQVQSWSETNGEIRPGGRNHYKPWTPIKLKEFIKSSGGTVLDKNVVMPASALEATPPRGGTGISRYKLNSIFFVKAAKVRIVGGEAYFKLSDVRQVKPTISAHMFFDKKGKELRVENVLNFYRPEF